MKKCTAYTLTLDEAEELLQNCLDNKGIKLVSQGFFYYAESDTQCLDGNQIDERMAQIIGVKKCEHYVMEDGMVVVVD